MMAGLAVQAQQSNSLKPELNVFPNPVIDNFSVYDNNDQVAHIVGKECILRRGESGALLSAAKQIALHFR